MPILLQASRSTDPKIKAVENVTPWDRSVTPATNFSAMNYWLFLGVTKGMQPI